MMFSRRLITQLLMFSPQLSIVNNMAVAGAQASEGPSVFPSATWQENSDINESGFTPDGVASVMMMLRDLPTTSLMVVTGGKIAFKYGDVAEVSYLASARKSILSMLFGKYVASGVIDLQQTIGDLGIDDVALAHRRCEATPSLHSSI